MSLNYSKYLKTLDSERRVVAVFQSLSVQTQLDLMRKEIHTLFDMVEKILDIQEGHKNEHAAMYSAAATPTTADAVGSAADADQPNTRPRDRDRDPHNLYL